MLDSQFVTFFIVAGLLWTVIVSTGVDQARRYFLNATVRRWLDGGSGALLLGFGVRLALAPKWPHIWRWGDQLGTSSL